MHYIIRIDTQGLSATFFNSRAQLKKHFQMFGLEVYKDGYSSFGIKQDAESFDWGGI